jgi:hypothetical protein
MISARELPREVYSQVNGLSTDFNRPLRKVPERLREQLKSPRPSCQIWARVLSGASVPPSRLPMEADVLRRLGLLVAATVLSVMAGLPLAGPAAAAPPSQTGERDCRWTAVCNPGLHQGWDNHRNVGG